MLLILHFPPRSLNHTPCSGVCNFVGESGSFALDITCGCFQSGGPNATNLTVFSRSDRVYDVLQVPRPVSENGVVNRPDNPPGALRRCRGVGETTLSRHRVRTLRALLCLPALFVASAGGAITSAIKTSASPAAYRAVIQGFINTQVAQLGANDPAAQKAARDELVSNSENRVGGDPASPQYQKEYATDLGEALLPLLKPTTKLRVRLNAAVVVGDVARLIHKGAVSDQLAEIAKKLLDDKETSLALWGVKTAKYAMADLAVNDGKTDTLADAVVKAVKAHATSEAVLEEAYSALTLDTIDTAPNFDKVLPKLLKVLEWRAAEYQNPDPPPAPLAEEKLPVLLSVTRVNVVNGDPKLRADTLKAMGDITCANLNAVANGDTRPELIEIIRKYGEAFAVFGQQMQDSGLASAGKAISTTSASMDPAKIGQECDGLRATLKSTGIALEEPVSSNK